MNDIKTDTSDWAANTARNTARLGAWTGAWLVTMAVANFGPKFIWQMDEWLTILAILINLGVRWASARGRGQLSQQLIHLATAANGPPRSTTPSGSLAASDA